MTVNSFTENSLRFSHFFQSDTTKSRAHDAISEISTETRDTLKASLKAFNPLKKTNPIDATTVTNMSDLINSLIETVEARDKNDVFLPIIITAPEGSSECWFSFLKVIETVGNFFTELFGTRISDEKMERLFTKFAEQNKKASIQNAIQTRTDDIFSTYFSEDCQTEDSKVKAKILELSGTVNYDLPVFKNLEEYTLLNTIQGASLEEVEAGLYSVLNNSENEAKYSQSFIAYQVIYLTDIVQKNLFGKVDPEFTLKIAFEAIDDLISTAADDTARTKIYQNYNALINLYSEVEGNLIKGADESVKENNSSSGETETAESGTESN